MAQIQPTENIHDGGTTEVWVYNVGERYRIQETLPIKAIITEPDHIETEFLEYKRTLILKAPPSVNAINFEHTWVIPPDCEEIGDVMLDTRGKRYSMEGKPW